MSSLIWPAHDWPLTTLTPAQRASWERDGYLVVPNIINESTAAAAAEAIRTFVGADPEQPETWYTNTLDIYTDRTPSGARPHHGPCGMVNLNHHQALWNLRQEPRLHGAFADLYGTQRLYVTADRQHFKPPQHPAHPAWGDPGTVHKGLHWDMDTRRGAWPVPYVIQGVVYLEETRADQGALRVVPGFHRRLEAWDASQPANRSAERLQGAAADELDAQAIAVEGGAGSLVVWHSALPHGPAPNTGAAPRISSYVAMLPVDAAPFLGPSRDAEAPLSMVDAGTLAYLEELEELAYPPNHPEHPSNRPGSDEGADGAAAAAAASVAAADGVAESVGSTSPSAEDKPSATGGAALDGACDADGSNGMPRVARAGLRRQSRERRAERWRLRLPLLDEDPREDELPHLVPGEEHQRPAVLTPLGERLVGLVEWEADDRVE